MIVDRVWGIHDVCRRGRSEELPDIANKNTTDRAKKMIMKMIETTLMKMIAMTTLMKMIAMTMSMKKMIAKTTIMQKITKTMSSTTCTRTRKRCRTMSSTI